MFDSRCSSARCLLCNHPLQAYIGRYAAPSPTVLDFLFLPHAPTPTMFILLEFLLSLSALLMVYASPKISPAAGELAPIEFKVFAYSPNCLYQRTSAARLTSRTMLRVSVTCSAACSAVTIVQ